MGCGAEGRDMSSCILGRENNTCKGMSEHDTFVETGSGWLQHNGKVRRVERKGTRDGK